MSDYVRTDEQKLDEWQEREAELAEQRREQGNREARRPDAIRETTTFGEIEVGDFITAEDGRMARWVEVVALEPSPKVDGQIEVTFRTPQPLGVAQEDRWVIDRDPDEELVRDASPR